MRFLVALLLVTGGSIAAFALSWFFLSMQNEQQAFEKDAANIAPSHQEAPLKPENVTSNTPQTTDSGAVNTQKDAKLELAEPTPSVDVLAGLPSVTLARIGPDGSAVIAGIAAPSALITIKENEEILGSGRADNAGEWVIILEENLSAGNHLLIVEMLTQTGEMRRDQRAVLVEIEDKKQLKPLVALVPMQDQQDQSDTAPAAEVEILSVPENFAAPITDQTQDKIDAEPASPEQPVLAETVIAIAPTAEPETPLDDKIKNRELQLDEKALSAEEASSDEEAEALPAVKASIFVNTLAWVSPTRLQINGTATSGAAIQVRFGKVSATAEYTPNKEKWSAIISLENQSSSLVEMQADLLDENKKTIASASLNIDVSQLEIGRDGSEMVVIQKGDMLWRIAYRTYGSGIRYLDIVKQNQTRIDDPDMIFPTQIFKLPSSKAEN